MADGNRVIGRDGSLPWHLPEDFRWFKSATLGKTVVMGRKTYESLGRPLPGRRNIVLSRGEVAAEVQVAHSVGELLAAQIEGEVFVIGGSKVYAELLPVCGWLYMSHVHGQWEGDTFFPEFESDFRLERVVASYEKFDVRLYRNRLIP